MTAHESAHAFLGARDTLDAREQRMGLPGLAEGDRTAAERAHDVYVRLYEAVNGDGLPDLSLIEQAGAHLIALHRWAVGVHLARPETGDADVAAAA